jgi:glycosyltransferase involved in cell wall biosynthesis
MISIIIPTMNRASSLKLAIQSFCQQDFPIDQYEILVVDNGSTDNTKEITETAIATYPSHQIHYIYEPEPGLLSGRHRGALEAQGDILTFVDDDIEADPNWLQAIHSSFDDPTVQLVGGRNLPKYETDPPEWLDWFWSAHAYGRICANLSLLDFGDQMREIHPNYVWGLNFSIRKRALFELGGFHPDCIPKHLQHFQGDGETGLTQKANARGYRAIYQPSALVYHHVSKERMTYEYFDKRYFYQGVCDSYSQIRNTKYQPELVSLNSHRSGLSSLVRLAKVYLKALRNRLYFIFGHLRKDPNPSTEELRLQQRFKEAYQQGYQFHQNAVHQNPELINWVMKEDYWDYHLPGISPYTDSIN